MNNFVNIVLLFMLSNTPPLLFDFGSKKMETNWYVVNDDVMGGLSTSSMIESTNSIVFKGTISLKNNGGFASIRSPRKSYDLSAFKTISLRFKSTGREFGIVLERYNRFYRPTHQLVFSSDSNEWVTATFPIKTFKERVLGKETGNFIDIETLEKIERIGIILFDKKEGAFSLEVDYIRFD